MTWNSIRTDEYVPMIAETVTIKSDHGDTIHAYYARPLSEGKHPGIVLIPHMPGWDEMYREIARRFADHGFMVMCPNIYERYGQGLPQEIAKKAMDEGGVSDESVMKDVKGALDFLKTSSSNNGKVGVVGTCSGGRHAFLAACTIEGFDAVVDCWGGGVVTPEDKATPSRPVSPHTYTEKLSIPLLGLFGNDDHSPTIEEVNQLEEELKKYNKDYTFYRYDGAGHGFWYYDKPMYRVEQAMDSWNKCLEFFTKHLK